MLRRYRLIYCLLWPVMHLLFRIRVQNPEQIPQGAMVLCAPHSNFADPVFLMMALGIRRYPRFMAKKELFEKCILGRILTSMGVFPVDRGNTDIRSIRTALTILREGGIVGIFPEGTRVHEEAGGEAHRGAVMLASHSGAPLVPVWLPRKKPVFHRIDIIVGKPYALPRMAGKELCQDCADELMGKIYALRENNGR